MASVTQRRIRLIGCISLLFLCCACSSAKIRTGSDAGGTHLLGEKERPLGSLSLNDSSNSRINQVHLMKVHKGYALRGNLDRSDKRSTNAVISKTKEYDWFAGVEWKWVF